jgi:hypothetical protein
MRRPPGVAGPDPATRGTCRQYPAALLLGHVALFQLLCLAFVILREIKQAAAKFSIEYFARKLAKARRLSSKCFAESFDVQV